MGAEFEGHILQGAFDLMVGLQESFRTSKGPRHRLQVHQIKGGSRIRRSDHMWEIRARNGEMSEITSSTAREFSPAADQRAQGGWESWVDWQNMTGNPLTSFVASWQVPPAPTVANGQLIYLFNGLQDIGGDHILQPVLQWGTSPAQGSGDVWGLASFWVGQESDPMFCSEWAAVSSGTTVTGRMTLTTQQNGLFSCTCRFDDYPGTELTAENLPNLVDCVLTLEAYGIGPNAPYPSVPNSDFSAVTLTTGQVTPAINWQPSGGAIVRVDGGNGGNIEVVYPAAGT
jgi:hypothetical protein